jgi:N-acetylmuramoyl-L-alanine amidase
MKKRTKRILILALMGAVLLAGIWLPWRQPTTQTFARLTSQTLVIDPGHGGEDGGAVSASGVAESGINLAIALDLDQLMGFYGVRTVLTRWEDVSIHDPSAQTLREKKVSDLHNRTDLVNETENATLISIHQNSAPSSRYHGTQVFYTDPLRSQALAQAVQTAVREDLDPTNTRTAQAIPSTVYLMNHVSCRAILVECGFLSNPEEDRLLQQKAHQQKLAMILASAYLTTGDGDEALI